MIFRESGKARRAGEKGIATNKEEYVWKVAKSLGATLTAGGVLRRGSL